MTYLKVPNHMTALVTVCNAFLYLESLRRENIFQVSQVSLTKIERQEIVSSIEYYIIYIAVFVDKLQNQESCMRKCLVH